MSASTPLPQSWNVPETFHSRLGKGAGRQRVMVADRHLLLILHQPPRDDDFEREGRFFWRAPDGTWRSDGTGVDIAGIDGLVRHLSEFRQVVHDQEEAEEKAAGADDYFQILQTIAPLRRTARHLHATLQGAREAAPDDHDLVSCRDQAGAIERATELLEIDAKNGLDYAMAKQAEEQARNSHSMALSSHKLNKLVATFFPIATFAAIFGMNVDHGLEHRFAPWLFWIMLLLGIGSGYFLRAALIDDEPMRRG